MPLRKPEGRPPGLSRLGPGDPDSEEPFDSQPPRWQKDAPGVTDLRRAGPPVANVQVGNGILRLGPLACYEAFGSVKLEARCISSCHNVVWRINLKEALAIRTGIGRAAKTCARY